MLEPLDDTDDLRPKEENDDDKYSDKPSKSLPLDKERTELLQVLHEGEDKYM